MKFTLLAITSTLLGSALAAEKAVVQNGCRETIYVQSYPQDGSAPGELATLKTGETYTEDRLDSGSVCSLKYRWLFSGLSSRALPWVSMWNLD